MNDLGKKLIEKTSPAYKAIADQIQSKESIVGIDARHTHILIINKLLEIEEKLDKLTKEVQAKPRN